MFQKSWVGIVLHVIILALFVLAVAGPWTFDLIMVPAEYACEIRLEGDFCGIPLSGSWMLFALASETVRRISLLFTGGAVLAGIDRLALSVLGVMILLLPFISTLLRVLPRGSRRSPVFHLAVWALAAGLILGLVVFASEPPRRELWGLWLYLVLAPAVFLGEAAAYLWRRRAGRSGGLSEYG